MQFKQYYRPKLPRNKYGAVSTNHIVKIANGNTMTYNMRNAEPTKSENLVLDLSYIPVIYDENDETDIIIETETPSETEI
jgi:hypothetical protein